MKAAKLFWHFLLHGKDPRDLIIHFLMLQLKIASRQISRPKLSDAERAELARLGKQLGHTLEDYAKIVESETFRRWYRDFCGPKNASSNIRHQGRPRISQKIEKIIIRLARENERWGLGRLTGELKKLSITLSRQTVGNILQRNHQPTAPIRDMNRKWAKFIKSTTHCLIATDFFTTTIWSGLKPISYYVLFFIDLKTRKITLGGITHSPNETWMVQIARNITSQIGPQTNKTYLIRDRDKKFTKSFDQVFRSFNILPLKLPPQSPNLNAFAERWILSIKTECLQYILPLTENVVRYAVTEYIEHYNTERPHQGIDNVIPLPSPSPSQQENNATLSPIPKNSEIQKHSRLSGLLNSYRAA